jgi:uncharacterized damage-inducible protein DinB
VVSEPLVGLGKGGEMNLDDLRLLVDYHYWARDRVLDASEALTPDQFTRDMGSSFRSVRDTLVHFYSAEWAWCLRWNGQSPTAHVSPDSFPDVATVRRQWAELEGNVRAVLDRMGADGLDRVIEYTMFNGDARASVFWQMVQHVVNHASYHRGQVTTMLRQLGATPPQSMDLITFYRTRGG